MYYGDDELKLETNESYRSPMENNSTEFFRQEQHVNLRIRKTHSYTYFNLKRKRKRSD